MREIEERNKLFMAIIRRKDNAASLIQRAWRRFRNNHHLAGTISHAIPMESNTYMQQSTQADKVAIMTSSATKINLSLNGPIISNQKIKKISLQNIKFNSSYRFGRSNAGESHRTQRLMGDEYIDRDLHIDNAYLSLTNQISKTPRGMDTGHRMLIEYEPYQVKMAKLINSRDQNILSLISPRAHNSAQNHQNNGQPGESKRSDTTPSIDFPSLPSDP